MKVYLTGFMGCGKTHLGRLLSDRLKIPFIDLDEKIAGMQGRSIAEIFARDGEEHFRLLEKDALHLLSESHETFVMATGGGTPCFYNNIDYLKKQGIVVWLNCSTDTLYKRLLAEKDKRPLIQNVDNADLKSFIIKKYSGRKIFYQQANVILPEEKISLDSLVDAVFHAKS